MKSLLAVLCLVVIAEATFLKRNDMSEDQLEAVEQRLAEMEPWELWELTQQKTKKGIFCGADEYQCTGSLCIPISKLCDGNDDCGNNLDEPKKCVKCKSKAAPFPCFLDKFNCVEDGDKCGDTCPATKAKLTEWGSCKKREDKTNLLRELIEELKKMEN